MSQSVHRSAWFDLDFELQYRWYFQHAGWEVAEEYLAAVEDTLQRLAATPLLGRRRRLRHPELAGMRSYRVARPFAPHLIFYRHFAKEIFVERMMHGARNLPRRLRETPGMP